MLTDRGVRIPETPTAGRRKYLKNMNTDRSVRISKTSIVGQSECLKKYAK
jgi:hypothetical protein